MEIKDNLVRVFTGTKITVNLLKQQLEDVAIPSHIQNSFESGVITGFSGGTPSSVDLFIVEADIEKASPIIDEFKKLNG